MNKTVLKSLIVLFMVLFVQLGNQHDAKAGDIYMGEYSNGQVAYLDTSSIRTDNHYVQGYHEGDTYSCLVKAVWPNSDQYDEVSYEFYIGQTVGIKKNGKQIYHTMKGALDFFDKNPVEKNLWAFFQRKHEQEWSKIPERIR